MKKLIYTAFVICGMLTASCSDLLNLESKTDVTNNYLFTTPEGLNTAVTGLYSLARELPGGADNNESNLYRNATASASCPCLRAKVKCPPVTPMKKSGSTPWPLPPG